VFDQQLALRFDQLSVPVARRAADQESVRRTMNRLPHNWPVNTTADERGFRVFVQGLIDVLLFEEDGVAHVSIGCAGSLEDDYPLVVRVDGRIVVSRV